MMQGGRTMTRETNKKGWGTTREMTPKCGQIAHEKRRAFLGGGKKNIDLKLSRCFRNLW